MCATRCHVSYIGPIPSPCCYGCMSLLVLLIAGTGVLAKRADMRWRRTPEQLQQLVALQVRWVAALLQKGAGRGMWICRLLLCRFCGWGCTPKAIDFAVQPQL